MRIVLPPFNAKLPHPGHPESVVKLLQLLDDLGYDAEAQADGIVVRSAKDFHGQVTIDYAGDRYGAWQCMATHRSWNLKHPATITRVRELYTLLVLTLDVDVPRDWPEGLGEEEQ